MAETRPTTNGTDEKSRARAAADLAEGSILASVEVAASPERVFQALASNEVLDWWVRPGVFDTREWAGDVRAGGRWQASGVGGGKPYTLEGEFLEVDPARKLVHTWHSVGAPGAPTTVTYLLEPLDTGTRVTLRQSVTGQRPTRGRSGSHRNSAALRATASRGMASDTGSAQPAWPSGPATSLAAAADRSASLATVRKSRVAAGSWTTR